MSVCCGRYKTLLVRIDGVSETIRELDDLPGETLDEFSAGGKGRNLVGKDGIWWERMA